MPTTSPRDCLIDFIKALASQLIIIHHLALYGPMSDAVYPTIAGIYPWLHDYALMAVQSFLVVGGYLAARARPATDPGLAVLAWRRYLRLVAPYAVALAAAVAAAALARLLIDHDDTPATPTPTQIAAHLLLLHDIAGHPSLSLGVWYVAIDFQLYVLLLVLLRLGRRHATAAVALLTAASLLWLNRLPDLDVWAPYFFGAYGLGYLVQRVAAVRSGRGSLLLAALLVAALLIDWRGRLVVAGATALVLLAGALGQADWRWLASRPVAWLGQISYAVFLLHYPVALAVGALVARGFGADVAANWAGLALTWLLTVAAGTLLHRAVEQRVGLRRRPLDPTAGCRPQ